MKKYLVFSVIIMTIFWIGCREENPSNNFITDPGEDLPMISGRLMIDLDSNGVADIPGVGYPIRLDSTDYCPDCPYHEMITYTDENGYYSFKDLVDFEHCKGMVIGLGAPFCSYDEHFNWENPHPSLTYIDCHDPFLRKLCNIKGKDEAPDGDLGEEDESYWISGAVIHVELESNEHDEDNNFTASFYGS